MTYAIKTGKLYLLSSQYILDCGTNSGCSGGNVKKTFNFLYQSGTVLNIDYPYTAKVGTCRDSEMQKVFYLDDPGYQTIYPTVEAHKVALRIAPLAVGFSVTEDFYYYKSGIYSGINCTSKINHAMIAIGFGTYGDLDYLLIRNQWGSGWGESGYIRILMSDSPKGGACLVMSYS